MKCTLKIFLPVSNPTLKVQVYSANKWSQLPRQAVMSELGLGLTSEFFQSRFGGRLNLHSGGGG